MTKELNIIIVFFLYLSYSSGFSYIPAFATETNDSVKRILIEEILNKYSKYNLKKGEILTKKLLIDANDIDKIKRRTKAS